MLSDVGHAVRALLRSPGVNLLTVLLLGLGIGLATTAFGFANAVFLRPLPFMEPDRLVRIERVEQGRPFTLEAGSLGEVSGANSFETVAAWYTEVALLEGAATVEHVAVARIGPSFWSMLGVSPSAGRASGPADGEDVAVLGNELWRRQFGGDAGVIGRTVRLGAENVTIIGVMADGFEFPVRAEMWRPMVPPAPGDGRQYGVAARLGSGATIAGATSELGVIAGRLGGSGSARELTFALREGLVDRDDGLGPLPWIAVAVALLILLIAAWNVAGLLLVRGVRRRSEMAIRSAIGGSRGRLIRQVLLESAVLGIAGLAVGAIVAVWGSAALERLLAGMPEWIRLGVDVRVLGFVAVTLVVVVGVVGIAPAFESTRVDVTTPLRGAAGGSTATVRMRRLAALQSMLQLALAFVVVLGAALLGRSFAGMTNLDFGVDAERVLQITPTPPPAGQDADDQVRVSYAALADAARGVAGVDAAAIAAPAARLRSQPDTVTFDRSSLLVDGQSVAMPRLRFDAVSPSYFEVMGLAVREGRAIDVTDGAAGEPVVVLSRTVADRLFASGPAVGRTVRLADGTAFTVAGVADDQFALYSSRAGVTWQPIPLVYAAWEQVAGTSDQLLVRTAGPASALLQPVVAALQSQGASIQPSAIRTLAHERGTTIRIVGWAAVVLGVFAIAALALALLGIYGVIAFRTAQRTREIGIRRALGADTAGILRLVLRGGAAIAATGIVIALPVTFAMGFVLRLFLYDVSGTDPVAVAGTALLFVSTALLAAWIPARRAAAIEPAAALGSDA